MAVLRENSWLGQQRIDVPQLRSVESQVRGDFDLLAGTVFAGKQPLIVRGFELANTAVGSPASGIEVLVASSISINFNASESGSLFTVPDDRANEELSSLNAKVSGSFTASATNYVGMDIIRLADATTSDILQFLNATTLLETSRTVPLGRTLDYRFTVSTTDFSSRPNLCPIAIVITNASNNISSVTDARELAFRLAPGGSFASTTGSYAFPGGRSESTSALDMTSGDKVISNQHDWMRAAMTRIQEIGGGEFWYSATADRNVTMIWDGTVFSNGENFEALPGPADSFYLNYDTQTANFTVGQVVTGAGGATGTISADVDNGATGTLTLTGVTGVFVDGEAITDPLGGAAKADATQYKTLHWKGIKFIFDNSTGYFNEIDDQTTDSAGLTNLTNGDCIYIDLDRTQNLDGVDALIAAKAAMPTLGPGSVPGARHIIAWMQDGLIYTRQSRYPVGSIPFDMIPATTAANGILRLSRDYLGAVVAGLSGLNTPTCISDRGGTITAVAGTNHNGLTINADGTGHGLVSNAGTGGGQGVVATGGTTGGTGVKGIGGTDGIGGEFVGTGSAVGVTGEGGAGAATSYGGSFTVQHANGTAVKGVGAGTGAGGNFVSDAAGGFGVVGTSVAGSGGSFTGGIFGITASGPTGVKGTSVGAAGFGGDFTTAVASATGTAVRAVSISTNGIGVSALGSGTEAGVDSVGGATNGPGVRGTGNAAGVGSGGDFTGGAAGGRGIDALGIGIAAGAQITGGAGGGKGIVVVGGGGAVAVDVGAGHAKFTGAAPAKTDAYTDTVTPINICKAWGVVPSADTTKYDDGFNLFGASPTYNVADIVITLGTAMANAFFVPHVQLYDANTTARITGRSAAGGAGGRATFTFRCVVISTGADVADHTTGIQFSFMVFGRQ